MVIFSNNKKSYYFYTGCVTCLYFGMWYFSKDYLCLKDIAEYYVYSRISSYANTVPLELLGTHILYKMWNLAHWLLIMNILLGSASEAKIKKKLCVFLSFLGRTVEVAASGVQVWSSLSSLTVVVHCKGAFNFEIFQYIYKKTVWGSFSTTLQWIFKANTVTESVPEQQKAKQWLTLHIFMNLGMWLLLGGGIYVYVNVAISTVY